MKIKPLLSNGKTSDVVYFVEEIVVVKGEKCVVFYANGYQCVPIKNCFVVDSF
jgi:hypothetical protein